MLGNTDNHIRNVFEECRDIFVKKLKDYGASWRIMRNTSITDQIFIKANRIRSIQILGNSMVDDSIESDFMGIVNYGIIAMIQSELPLVVEPDISEEQALELYDKYKNDTYSLLLRKNHDYGDAWKSIRIDSLVDLILTKVYRTKQIEDNNGITIISEGVNANYMDMINYSVFAIIKLRE